jgi:hypothetical protein
MRTIQHFIPLLLTVLASVPVMAFAAESDSEPSLAGEVSSLKADVAALNNRLFELEEEILSPTNTQVAVYVSFAARDYLVLDSIEISVDGQPAVSHLYTEQERRALKKGGVQRLYLGNLSAGEHVIGAVLNGQGANDHYYRKDAQFTIQKSAGKAQYELVVQAKAPSFAPGFRLKEWQ